MAPQLRIGVLGAAGIARKNVRAIGIASDALCVTAVGSRSLEKAQQFIAKNGLEGKARAFGSYQEVLDCPDVDALYIPLPTGMHVEWITKSAAAKKHVLLEKPVALNPSDMAIILETMRKAGLVLMDGTMWSHSPRAREMAKALQGLGKCHDVKALFTMRGNDDFMKNNIRTKPELDGLGCLGDLGWYCVRASLWAFGWELPQEVVAHQGYTLNDRGVVMDGGATLIWAPETGEQQRHADIFYSFQQAMCQDLIVTGQKGSLRLSDFVIPHNEKQCSYSVTQVDGFGLSELANSTTLNTTTHTVDLPEPQEVQMWRDFAACVHACGSPDQEAIRPPSLERGSVDATSAWWAKVAADNQRVVHAVGESMKQGCKPVKV